MNWKESFKQQIPNEKGVSSLKEELEKIKSKKYQSEDIDEYWGEDDEEDTSSETFRGKELEEKDEALLLDFFEKGFITREAYEAIKRNPVKMKKIIEMLKKLKVSKEFGEVRELKRQLQKSKTIPIS